MKQNFLLVLLFLSFHLILNAQQSQKPKVMILGMYHFSNPGLDAANIKADDVKAEKRQQELDFLAKQLAAFKPTKIAVEVPYGDTIIPKRYQEYLKHKDLLKMRKSETYQIGFRLAGQLNHNNIYPIDYRLNIEPESMGKFAQENPQKMQVFQGMIKSIQDTLNYWTEEILYKKTIGDFLKFMNTDDLVAANHSLYLELVNTLWSEKYSPGAEMISLWYKRNTMIFQNLIRITDFDNPDERILIVFGQGHVQMLKDHIEDANYYEWVEVNDYLK